MCWHTYAAGLCPAWECDKGFYVCRHGEVISKFYLWYRDGPKMLASQLKYFLLLFLYVLKTPPANVLACGLFDWLYFKYQSLQLFLFPTCIKIPGVIIHLHLTIMYWNDWKYSYVMKFGWMRELCSICPINSYFYIFNLTSQKIEAHFGGNMVFSFENLLIPELKLM